MKLNKLLIVFGLATILFSCDDEHAGETSSANGVNLVSFQSDSFDAAPSTLADETFQIPVQISTISTSERTLPVAVDVLQTTALDNQYELASSVVIPADSHIGYLEVVAKGANLEVVPVELTAKIAESPDYFTDIDAIKINLFLGIDCPTPFFIWTGTVSVEDVGYGTQAGFGNVTDNLDCDILVLDANLANSSIPNEAPFELNFTPDASNPSTGTVDVPAQRHCTACNAGGLDSFYTATGTYDESSRTINLSYVFFRSDGTIIWTGTNNIVK